MFAQDDERSMSRRCFLATSAKATLGFCLLNPVELLAGTNPLNTLRFYHTHTKEQFCLTHPGKDCPREMKRNLFSFLRDFRTGESHPIDFKLMDTLHKIQLETGRSGVYEVISGYRSPVTNEKLRKNSNGVAKKSFHMDGRAIDIRNTAIPTSELRDVAGSLKAGGVGYYAESDFIHIDTGRVRRW